MNKLTVIYSGTKYYNNGWVAGSVRIKEIIETDDNYDFMIGQILSVRGTVGFEPRVGAEYKLVGEMQKDKTWGMQMEIFSLNEKVCLETDEDKRFFLEQILTEKQVDDLYSMYEDPFALLENEDIPALIKVNGIGEIIAEKLINRFQSTIDNAPAYVYFKKFDVTNNLVKKLINVYKGAAELIAAFEKNPYILMEDVDGIGFIRADEIAIKSGVAKNSPIRIENGIKYFLMREAEDNGCTWVSQTYFKTGITKLLNLVFDEIKNIFKEMWEKEIIYVSNDKKRIALKKYYDLEKNIANKLKIMQQNQTVEYNEVEINEKIKKQEDEQGFEFTDEQKEAIHKVLKNNVSVICGNAGTGKTTVVKGFLSALPDNYSVALTSLSGQASKRMSEATGYPASTIHRLLGYVPDLGFTYNEKNKLTQDVIILDECSMVSIDLFWMLIRAIDDETKLIILGDNKQLPPIGVGNLFTDILNEDNNIPKQMLTKIHRQAARSAIISVSADVRNRKQIVSPNANGEETLGELQDLTLCAYQDKSQIFERVIEAFKSEYEKHPVIRDIQIVVPMKERGELSQLALNNEIQKIVNPSDRKYVQMGKKFVIKVGDKVINRKNNYKVFDIEYKPTQVFNGSMGIVEEIYDDYMIIDFFDIGKIRITSDLYNGLQLAYAITCHSAQGSQWKTTIVALDYSSFILLSNEWVYTAITRASKMCYLIAETKALRYAITNTKIKSRDTFLKDLLLEEENELC